MKRNWGYEFKTKNQNGFLERSSGSYQLSYWTRILPCRTPNEINH